MPFILWAWDLLSLDNISTYVPPSEFSSNTSIFQPRKNLMWYSFGMNQQSFDLGLKEDFIMYDRGDLNFNLVMITERMEESLVLLADLLCVPLESVAIVKNQSVRPRGDVKKLSKGNRDKLEQYLQTDRFLYDHFWRRLDTRIRWEGKSKSKRGEMWN